MRIAVSIIAIAALAACEQAEAPATEPVELEEAPPAVMQPGLYSVGDGSTAYGTTRLNEDGTYVDYGDNDEVVGGGTWRTADGELCFDPEGDGEEEQERCWTNEPAGEDGSFVTTRVDGAQSYVVTPIAEEAADNEAAADAGDTAAE